MTKRRSPSERWRAQHGFKIRHRLPVDAFWHWRANSIDRPDRLYSIYACRWGDWHRDGETAPQHYHVGKSIQSDRIGT